MISKLYDLNNNLISEAIETVIPRFDSIKVKNRLLDGTYHIQTIGTSVKQIDILFNVNESGKVILDNCEAISEPIVLKRDGMYYKGLIMASPQWTPKVKGEISRRKYSGQITIVINEEGVDG